MKQTVVSFLLFFVLLITVQGQDKVYTADNIPKIHLQDKTRYVCDPSGILSPEPTRTIDNLLYGLEQQTGIETVVIVVPSIGEADCFDFSHQLLNGWGVGKKGKDNGLVILLVTDQRCIQFYTGYGLEGVLPDAVCKRIQSQEMIPSLKDGDWDKGMVAGIRVVCGKLDGSMVNDDEGEEVAGGTIVLAIMGFMAVIFGIAFFAIWQTTQCPRCGKHKLQRTNSRLILKKNGVKTEEITCTCRNCGHTLTREHTSYDENHSSRGGGGVGPIFGGGFGGGGGSFGGGRGGGGGAGSRF